MPWVHQGRSRSGVDCAGLLVMVLRHYGVTHQDRADYGEDPTMLRFLKHLEANLQNVYANEIAHGRVAVFSDNRLPCHVGFFTERPEGLFVIHSTVIRGRVVEEPIRVVNLRAKLVSVLDIPGAE